MILEVVFVAALIVTAFLAGGYTALSLEDRGEAVEEAERAQRQADRDALAAAGFVRHTATDMASTLGPDVDAGYSADGTRL